MMVFFLVSAPFDGYMFWCFGGIYCFHL